MGRPVCGRRFLTSGKRGTFFRWFKAAFRHGLSRARQTAEPCYRKIYSAPSPKDTVLAPRLTFFHSLIFEGIGSFLFFQKMRPCWKRRKNTVKSYFPFQWHITDACDQRCRHCYIYSSHTQKKIDSMTYDEMEQTFYNCLDFCEMNDRLPYFI